MRPYTENHPAAIGNGSLTGLISKRLDITTFDTDADALDCLKISYTPEIFPGGEPAVTPDNATYTVAVTTNVITITYNVRNAVGTFTTVTHTITPAAAKVAWSAGAASALSLKDVIDLLNEDDAGGTSGKLLCGIKASIGPGGMYDMVVDQTAAGFQAESATAILPPGTTGEPTTFFKRDMAVYTIDSDFLCYWRLAFPEEGDRQLFKLLDLYGTMGTNTGATLYVVRDDVDDYVTPTGTWATDFGNHDVVLQVAGANVNAGPQAATYSLEHNPAFAAPQRGPLVVILKGDTDSTQTLNLVASMQVVS